MTFAKLVAARFPFAALAVAAACGAAPTRCWYVSTQGRDAWSGLVEAPAADGRDGPFATLGAALAESRKHAGVRRTIVLLAGRHFVEKTVALDARDQGLAIEGRGPGRTILYGGRRIAGWGPDVEGDWSAPLPEVASGKWDFRLLVVNDEARPRARLPETGRFEHLNTFPVRWMSTAGGGWERKPTKQERTTLTYREGDLGPWLSTRNAEFCVYHMWDESMVGVASHDAAACTVTFSSPCTHPPGAFRVKTYVVWNLREGMKRPGQWRLDRDAGKVVYRPLPGEDLAAAQIVAPTVETIIAVRGARAKPVSDIAIRDLTLAVTNTPLRTAGFGAGNCSGALQLSWTRDVRLAGLEVTNTAGHAIRDWYSQGLVVENCHLHQLGACGVRIGGGSGRIEGNRIHHVGLLHSSAIGLSAGGRESTYVIRRNEIHHTPYSGMTLGGKGSVVEENLLYACMRELHDGAAIYVSGATGDVIRRNVVRDIVPEGKGYGVSSYYLDEKCRDCVVEGNVSLNVERPSQNHMTLNCVLRNNVFISSGDLHLSFPRSSGYRVSGNTLHFPGELKINDPDAVSEWRDNLIVRAGAEPALADVMPRPEHKPRERPLHAKVRRAPGQLKIDGSTDPEEWPSVTVSLGQTPDQRKARGAPVAAKFCTDDENLYVAVIAVCMFPETRKLGTEWGRDEGVELALEGRREDGEPVTYVLRGFTDGSFHGLTLAGATEAEASALTQQVAYGAAVEKKTWRCEWAVPLAALRFDPAARRALPGNVTVFRSEDAQLLQWAGTLGETWDLKWGGRVLFEGKSQKRPKPEWRVPRAPRAPTLDGEAGPGEWPGKALRLAEQPSGVPLDGAPCSAHAAFDARCLYVSVAVPVAKPEALSRGSEWRVDDAAEVCLRGKTADGKPVTWVVHGFVGGACDVSTEAGAPAAAAQALLQAVEFKASVGDSGWSGEWRLPLAALGVTVSPDLRLPFNLGVFRSESKQWINWVGTGGATWKLDSAGLLRFGER